MWEWVSVGMGERGLRRGYTRLLHRSYIAVTPRLCRGYIAAVTISYTTAVTMRLHRDYIAVTTTRLHRGCYNAVTSRLRRGYARLHPDYITAVTMRLHRGRSPPHHTFSLVRQPARGQPPIPTRRMRELPTSMVEKSTESALPYESCTMVKGGHAGI